MSSLNLSLGKMVENNSKKELKIPLIIKFDLWGLLHSEDIQILNHAVFCMNEDEKINFIGGFLKKRRQYELNISSRNEIEKEFYEIFPKSIKEAVARFLQRKTFYTEITSLQVLGLIEYGVRIKIDFDCDRKIIFVEGAENAVMRIKKIIFS